MMLRDTRAERWALLYARIALGVAFLSGILDRPASTIPLLAWAATVAELALASALIRYGSLTGMFDSPGLDKFPFTAPPGWGAPLPVIYLIWAAVVISLYPVCRWYAEVKARRTDWWLSYL